MAKVGEVLKFRDGGPSVEEARKQMIAAKEAPSGMVARPADREVAPAVPVAAVPVDTASLVDALEPEFESEIPVVPVVPAAVPAPVVSAPTPIGPRVERVETDQFTGEVKQDGGQWVAELRYKTGGGTERFIAKNRSELMLKLLEGKGHATMRVHKAVRREKLGWSELDKQYPLPGGVTSDDFTAMTDKAQDALLWSVANDQIHLFLDAHPEYVRLYKCPENADKMNKFLAEHKPNPLPITLRNLEFAFEDLTESGLLERISTEPEVPVATSLPVPAPTPTPVRTDSAPVVAAPTPVPTVVQVPAAPAVVVRKRGTTGLQPGQSSLPDELRPAEDGGTPRQLSEAELRKLPLPELKRIANQDRRMRSGATR